MLVLSRKPDERIIIGTGPDAVVVTVLSIRGDRVRLGVTAPRDTPVNREEVYDELHRKDSHAPRS